LASGLAAQADSIKGSDHALSLILAMEGYRREKNLLTRTTLFELLQFSPYTRLFGYNGPVSSVAVSPDGMVIASTSCREKGSSQCKYGEITLSDASGQPIAKLIGDYGMVNSLAFHQYDDRLLLAAGGCVPEDGQNMGCTDGKGQITLWDIAQPSAPLSDVRQVHTGPVKTVAINPAGNLLASGSFDMTIILWDVSDPASPGIQGIPLQGHSSFVESVAFSRDGNTLVSGGDDQRIILWDVTQPSSAAPIGAPIEQHTAKVSSIAFDPAGGKFASVGDDRMVILWDWDLASRELRNPIMLEGHGGYVKSVAFNADGTILASAGFDNKVILWNTATGKPIGLPLSVHTKAINTVAFGLAKTSYLVSGGDDRVVIRWDLSTRQPLSQLLENVSPPQGLGTVATNGTFEASVVEIQKIKLSGREEPLKGHTGAINTLSFSPDIDGKLLLASASDDQTVILWDVTDPATANIFLKLESFDNPVRAAYFDGDQLVTIENNGEKDVRSIRWDITPSGWLSHACEAVKIVKPNLNTDEWGNYFPKLDYRKTCEANP
jgi:WD40 repeat protein